MSAGLSQRQLVENFIREVEVLSVADFGDFKRRVGLDLDKLSRSLGSTPAPLAEIKNQVLFRGEQEIESARLFVLQKAHDLLGSYAS